MSLRTERNTPNMGNAVLYAAAAALDIHESELSADFEHGQWWITRISTGAQWSVCDASGGNSVDGFDFEQVTEGDEEESEDEEY